MQLPIESPVSEFSIVPGQASHQAGPLTVVTAVDHVGPQWISRHITQHSQEVIILLENISAAIAPVQDMVSKPTS